MAIKKKKISELPLCKSFIGLYTIGVNTLNESVKVSLEFIKTAIDNAIAATNEATAKANLAASNATSSAVKATSAATSAEGVIDRTNQANELANSTIQRANDISDLGLEEIANMQAIIQQVINYAQIVPTRIELEYTPKITLGNPIEQSIVARLYPKFVTQNTLFLPADGDAVVVSPLGKIMTTKVGKSKIYVVPTHNTSLMQTVEIEILPPYMREIGTGGLRLLSNGTLRLT